MTQGVYGLINEDDKIVYIGSSQDIEGRYIKHIKDLKENKNKCRKLQEAFNDGEFSTLQVKIIEEVENKNKLFDIEKDYILELKPLYNMTLVSPLGNWALSNETKDLISEKTIEAMADAETRFKTRTRIKGRTPWNKGMTFEDYKAHSKESYIKQGETMALIHQIRKDFNLTKKDKLPIQARIRNNLIEGKKYGVYAAGPWFTQEQDKNNLRIKEILEEFNVKAFYPRFDAKSNTGKLTLDAAQEIFYEDLDGILDSYVVIADITDYGRGRDVGTAIEMGFAFAHEIPVVVLDFSENKKSNVMIAGLTQSYIRTFEEFKDWLNGETIMHIEDKELQ